MKHQGWVKLYRTSVESSVWKNPIIWAVWSWCLLKANHKENKFPFNGNDIIIHQGKFITGTNRAIDELPNISVQQYRTAIKYLKSTNRITSKSTNKFTIISVINWEKYQDIGSANNTTPINNQQRNDKQLTTNNNNYNLKEFNNNIAKKETHLETPEKQINEIMNIFRKINFAVELKNTTERNATSKLISEIGFQDVKKWSEYAFGVQDKEFAPQINTPLQLWKKFSALKRHKKLSKNNKFNNKLYEQKIKNKYAGLSKTSK